MPKVSIILPVYNVEEYIRECLDSDDWVDLDFYEKLYCDKKDYHYINLYRCLEKSFMQNLNRELSMIKIIDYILKLKKLRKFVRKNVIFIYRKNTDNIGDLNCCPKQYFSFFKDCKDVDIISFEQQVQTTENKIYIVGGGGLLQEFFEKSMNNILLLSHKDNVILWSIGLDNRPNGKIFDINKISKCKLVGIRDINTMYEYLPCVSCMSALFDKYKNTLPKKKIRAYLHCDFTNIPKLPNIETLINNEVSLKQVIKFLSGAEHIITNSFHGAYWATLLNRKVIVIPWTEKGITKYSDKFLNLKYMPVYLEDIKDYEKVLEQAKNYPFALEEARNLNKKFYKRVRQFITEEALK